MNQNIETATPEQFGIRLQQAIAREGVSQTEFARRAGISLGAISELVRGLRNPSAEFLLAVKITFGISADWLLTGKGTMLGHAGINIELFQTIQLQIALARAAVIDVDMTAKALLLLIQNGKMKEVLANSAFSEYLDKLSPVPTDSILAAEIYNNNLDTVDPNLQLRNMLRAAVTHFEARKPVNRAARLTGAGIAGQQINIGQTVHAANRDIVHHHHSSKYEPDK